MPRNRSTKIVATLGPASSTYSQIFALAEAGVDVFRLNASHGTQFDHAERYRQIRAVEETLGRPIGVLLDLQGPKLRVGTFANGPVTLATGDRFRLDLDPTPGDRGRVCVPHPEIFASVEPGHELLLNDGRMRLRVLTRGPDHAETEVLVGGVLSDRKGMNVPGTALALSALSDKDRSDLQFGLMLGVDWIGLSFVQRPEDILEARALIGDRAHIMTKIEKPAALPRLEEIIALSDAVMVARGDLGVELPPEDVPGLQKRMIRLSRAAGKPVIVATQMLESMITEPTPTRAEASDVATAVYDGADAVMLSAESASGKHPVEAVAMMDRIIRRVEHDPLYRRIMDAEHPAPEATPPRRPVRRRSPDRRDDLRRGHRDLHLHRLHRPPCLARAADRADPGAQRPARDGPATGARLGRPPGVDLRRAKLFGNGRTGEHGRRAGRHRQAGCLADRNGGRAVRDAGDNQQPAGGDHHRRWAGGGGGTGRV